MKAVRILERERSRERKCGRSSKEREFPHKRINILVNMKGLLYSPVGRLEGSPPMVRNF